MPTPTPDFRALFESAPDLYLALAPDLTVVAASDAYLRAIRTERGQIVGRGLPDLLTEEGFGRELLASLARVLASRRADTLRVRGYGLGTAGGVWSGDLRLTNAPVYGEEGEVAYILHRVEEDRGGEGAASAADTAGAATAASAEELASARSREEFLAGLAHDLRNPLAPIVNSLHIARLPNVSEEQRERLRELTERQVVQLTRLIDDLLDVSRLSSGKVALQRERLDLADLVRGAALTLGDRIADRNLRLTFALPERPLWTLGDRLRLSQAVANLLENACAFTEPGGEIAIRLAVVSGTTAVLTVLDTGIGIPEDLLPRIFEPFSQGEDARGGSGLGLGLALVKSLVEMHGGTIAAASEGVGRGSTFTLHLPLAPMREEAAPRPIAAGPRPHRILIVEDNVDAAESLRLFLELTGHEVTVAHDGSTGVARARETQPEVVLCDIGLPGEMDGYAVARALRSDPELSFTRLIALTGYGQAEDRRLASEAGFDLHLTKPTDPDALLRVLASFF
ncbi:MAG TPA: ATP-binding protein [Thermoanaerobaculia bacterium]|nr:ATP-binding protein [Thermoanaerobaculia bacterium]